MLNQEKGNFANGIIEELTGRIAVLEKDRAILSVKLREVIAANEEMQKDKAENKLQEGGEK